MKLLTGWLNRAADLRRPFTGAWIETLKWVWCS